NLLANPVRPPHAEPPSPPLVALPVRGPVPVTDRDLGLGEDRELGRYRDRPIPIGPFELQAVGEVGAGRSGVHRGLLRCESKADWTVSFPSRLRRIDRSTVPGDQRWWIMTGCFWPGRETRRFACWYSSRLHGCVVQTIV